MRATAEQLRDVAKAKVRATALTLTREAYCPVCGQSAKLHVEAQEYVSREAGAVVAASACATWECCVMVGRTFREVVQA